MSNHFSSTIALVTGSNRGLGRALVEELHARGAAKIYAASRTGDGVPTLARVVPLALDVTDRASVRAAAAAARDVTLLVNNAGTLASYSVLGADRDGFARDLAVNYYSVLDVVRAFEPNLARGAAIANVLSVVSLASMPGLGGYSASKAAAWSLTQSLRGELRAKGIRVHAVFPGPIDTDMIRALDMVKASPAEVARATLDGIAAGADDIAPDAMSRGVLATFAGDPRAVERQFAS
jgi:NAD(P)-dependent dehydrogenase (short-subunit alcohol dehydrogenase family)